MEPRITHKIFRQKPDPAVDVTASPEDRERSKVEVAKKIEERRRLRDGATVIEPFPEFDWNDLPKS